MNYSKIFNYIMLSLVIISMIMSFLASLYLSEKELELVMKYFAFKN